MNSLAEIQRALIALGYNLGKGGPSGKGDDGIWGANTAAAIESFQKSKALLGDIGEKTKKALGDAVLALEAGVPAARTVPSEWMPNAKMLRVICHWTAGQSKASPDDRQHYHLLIEDDGNLVRGIPTIDKNDAGGVKTGYAAHTLNCNSGSIGVSLCGMAGAIESPFNPGKRPITKTQWETLPGVIADLCRRYKIPVGPKTVLSHAEVQDTLGITQRGKWDIARLPFDPSLVGAHAIGDSLRSAVAKLL